MKKPSSKLFYGWWIVVAAVLFQYMSLSLSQSMIGVFLTPMVAELGWPVWQYTLGSSLALGAGSLSGLVVGPLVDRVGPRRPVFVGLFCTAVLLYGFGQQSNIWLFWGLHLLIGMVGWSLFSSLIMNAAINKWFVQKRGWALSLGSIGVSLANMITPLVMTAVVDAVGWRSAYQLLAGAVLVIGIPVAFLLRRMPEDHGLLPDGAVEPLDLAGTAIPTADLPAFTAAEAVRTRTFWQLVVGFGLIYGVITAVVIHGIPLVTGAGFARSTAALGFTLAGIGNLCSKPLWGSTLQSVAPKKLIVFGALVATSGICSILGTTIWPVSGLLFVGFFLFGFGFGGTIPVGEFLWATYFGRLHIGAIRGIGQPLSFLVPTVMPVVVGGWFDVTGSYRAPFLMLMGLYLLAAVLVWGAARPE